MTMFSTTDKPLLKEFYIVDFDRTLIDSDKIFEVFVEVAKQFIDIPIDRITHAQQEIKSRGDSFDTAGYVRDCLNQAGRKDDWDKLEKKFIHESRSLNYFMPGAMALLDWLTTTKKSFGILTYGNPLWQRVKLTATGLQHIRHIIIEQKEKGAFIKNWQYSNGDFGLPDSFGGETARKIIMIDDKAVSFKDFPDEPSKGYWVLNPSKELPSQLGVVPSNVIRFKNLSSVLHELSEQNDT